MRLPISQLHSRGDGWSVSDVVCTAGPQDRAFEEQHSQVSIAIVVAGTFQYRSTVGRRELMTPGSLLLGNAGQCFECGHEHGTGDRCLAFRFSPEYFERIAAEAGGAANFRVPRLPPLRATSAVIARASAAASSGAAVSWEELSLELAAQAVQIAEGLDSRGASAPAGALAGVTAAVRRIERDLAAELTLASLAHEARLSPYHFLRTFQRLTGVTPHQFVLRKRLRKAAGRILTESPRVIDIALDCGFRDLSNFNHAFRAEFGLSPREFRSKMRGTRGSSG